MCWYLRCGTCEHCEFRWAFLKLIAGKRPFTSEWSEASRPTKRFPPSALRRPWPWNDQLLLSRIMAGASPKRVARVSGFPDWLGYLGLGLAYTEGIEREQRSLTKSWVPELLGMLPSDAPSRTYFEQVLDEEVQYLRWCDLARIEKDIIKANRRKSSGDRQAGSHQQNQCTTQVRTTASGTTGRSLL